MVAAQRDLSIEQGSTFRLSFVYATEGIDADTPGPPYDLRGASARLQVRPSYGSPDVTLEVTSDDNILLGGVLGTVVVMITDEQTEALGPLTKAVKGVYDLKIIWPSGDETRLLQGKVSISPAVTWDAP